MRKLALILCLFLAANLQSQDIFFTQKFNVNTYLNPAMAGNMEKLNRLSFVYRDQWRSVPVPFVSSFIGYDRKFWTSNNNMISGGVNFYFDKVGDGNLNTYIPNVQLAYTRFVNEERQAFSWGVELGYTIRTLGSGLTFDTDFLGETSPEAIAGSTSAFRLGMGFNFKTKMGKKSFWNFGASVYNPHQPNMSFAGVIDDNRPVRYIAALTSELFMTDKWSFSPFFNYQRQEKINEYESAGIVNYYTAIGKTDLKVSVGAGYRVKDAPIVYSGFKVKDLQVGVSYDINNSPFSSATLKRGAGEVTLNYEFGKKKEKEIEEIELEVYEEEKVEEEQKEEEEKTSQEVTSVIPVEDKIEPLLPIIPAEIYWAEKIDAQAVVSVFFFNDEPNPKYYSTKTDIDYGQALESYRTKRDAFKEQIGEEETDKFFNMINKSLDELKDMLDVVKNAAETGLVVQVDLTGYASPLASAAYNLNLTKRRLESVKLYLEAYEGGIFKEYIQNGSIRLNLEPLGKSKAPQYVSSSTKDTKQSIYSPAASYERRVEIKISLAP